MQKHKKVKLFLLLLSSKGDMTDKQPSEPSDFESDFSTWSPNGPFHFSEAE